MSEPSANSPALPSQSRSAGWTQRKFLFLVAFALALHVALISIFGTHKTVVPRAVTGAPHLQLADAADELIVLGDPTLFARPNAHDFVTAFWQRPVVVKPPDFRRPENPLYLPPAPAAFGNALREFVQTNPVLATPLNFWPEPKASELVIPFDDTMPHSTSVQVSGELASRLLNPIAPPWLAWNDVIPPSRVQVLVDPAGNVVSAVLLESSTLAAADQRALQFVGNLRFTPAPRLTFGDIIFTWHTVPVTGTNDASH